MDIANIFNKITEKFNEEERCGLCWKFIFGGRSDYFNNAAIVDGEECCVRIGVLKNSFTGGYKRDANFSERVYREWNIEIFAGIPSRLDIMFYNEIPGHPVEESKWVKYLYPVMCCMDEAQINVCDVHNCNGSETTVEIWQWNGEMKLNYSDSNLDGWLFRAVIREWFN